MKFAVVGATGVLGRHVLPRLIEGGHEVIAGVRSPEHGERLLRMGINSVSANILDAGSLPELVEGCDAALHLATAVPKPGAPPNWELNDRIRREGTANLLAACAGAGVGRYLQQSIAMILNTDDSRAQTEEDPVTGQGVQASTLEMEAMVRAASLDGRIVRGGAFYGPGTGRPDDWLAAAEAGELDLPGDGRAYLSLIHVADMAAACVAALEADAANSTWNAVDDDPASYGAVFGHIAALAGAPQPEPGGPVWLPSFRVSNAKLKAETGWRPRYPSFHSGFAA